MEISLSTIARLHYLNPYGMQYKVDDINRMYRSFLLVQSRPRYNPCTTLDKIDGETNASIAAFQAVKSLKINPFH